MEEVPATPDGDLAPAAIRLPATEIEAAAIAGVKAVLSDTRSLLGHLGELPASQIAAVVASASRILSDIENAAGVPNYLGKMIRSFEYRRDRLVVTVSGTGMAGVLGIDRLASEWPSNRPADGDYSITVPSATKRRGPQMKLVVGTTSPTTPNRSLVTAVVRAWDWANRLQTGEVGSMAELCAKEGVTDSYVSQLLPLAFLSPATVEDILRGKQDPTLTADRLIRRENVPHLWRE